MCHCAFQQQVLQSKKQASPRHLKSIDISNWLVEKSGRNHAPFEGVKKDGIIVKPTGAYSCFSTVNSISHVRSLHLGKLGWMSGTSFNTLHNWIDQSINLSTLISHKKKTWVSKQKNDHRHVHQLQEQNEVRGFVPGCWDCRCKKNIRT